MRPTATILSPAHVLTERMAMFRIIHEYLNLVPFKKRWRIGRQLGAYVTATSACVCYVALPFPAARRA